MMETSVKVVEDAIGVKAKNLFNRMEWAGAFGDVGTLIPFVVAYITIVILWGSYSEYSLTRSWA